jgi:hypothetical protein
VREFPPGTKSAILRRAADGWSLTREFSRQVRGQKGVLSGGPFKRAFTNRFVLVVGTKGTEEENRESLELARFHAETWWYRANGSVRIVRDVDLPTLPEPSPMEMRNLVLYGNADTNAAWAKQVPASCPLRARRGEIALGERTWKGEGLGAVFVFPRAGSPNALVGAFASTGVTGTRVGYGLLPFVSGVGYPDYAVYGPAFLSEGDGGVLAAGWFDHRWALQPGGFLREAPATDAGGTPKAAGTTSEDGK